MPQTGDLDLTLIRQGLPNKQLKKVKHLKNTHAHTKLFKDASQTLWEHLVLDNVKKQILFSFNNLIYVKRNLDGEKLLQ